MKKREFVGAHFLPLYGAPFSLLCGCRSFSGPFGLLPPQPGDLEPRRSCPFHSMVVDGGVLRRRVTLGLSIHPRFSANFPTLFLTQNPHLSTQIPSPRFLLGFSSSFGATFPSKSLSAGQLSNAFPSHFNIHNTSFGICQ